MTPSADRERPDQHNQHADEQPVDPAPALGLRGRHGIRRHEHRPYNRPPEGGRSRVRRLRTSAPRQGLQANESNESDTTIRQFASWCEQIDPRRTMRMRWSHPGPGHVATTKGRQHACSRLRESASGVDQRSLASAAHRVKPPDAGQYSGPTERKGLQPLAVMGTGRTRR